MSQGDEETRKIEEVEEENKSENTEGEEEANGVRNINIVQQKKNFLTKSLLDQTKELCYKHSAYYKDFDSIFAKIESRFSNWEIFEDDEILQAG